MDTVDVATEVPVADVTSSFPLKTHDPRDEGLLRQTNASSSSSSSFASFPSSSQKPKLSFGISQILGKVKEREREDSSPILSFCSSISSPHRKDRNREDRELEDRDRRHYDNPDDDYEKHNPVVEDDDGRLSHSTVTKQDCLCSANRNHPSDHVTRSYLHPMTLSLLPQPPAPFHPRSPGVMGSSHRQGVFYRPIGVLGEGYGDAMSFHADQMSVAAAAAMFPWMFERRDRITVARRVGHPYQNRTPPKRKKPRTSFTRLQIIELEKRFHRQKYLASAERSSLAKSLSMSDGQVKTWFQNRRTKWRRQTAEEREAERQAANRLLLRLHPESCPRTIYNSPDPLCMNNASLHALHNLQPWADDYTTPPINGPSPPSHLSHSLSVPQHQTFHSALPGLAPSLL